MQKKFKNVSSWLFIIFIALFLYSMVFGIADSGVSVAYSDFINLVKNEKITKIDLCEDEVTAIYPDGVIVRDGAARNTKIKVRIPSTDALYSDIGNHISEQTAMGKLKFTVCEPKVSWVGMITPITSILLLVFLVIFLVSGMGGKNGGFTKNRAKLMTDGAKKTKFSDVAGATEEKEELMELVEFLKNPLKFISLGARIPKGVLLVGSPGTGKTLLARAVAGEAGVPFFSISGSDFVELYVGVGASRVRDLFEQAKKQKPCIIFIDEIDAVGRKRGAGMGGGHDEREQTLNQLLVEMDGFGANEGIIIIAATNRPDILDPALLRPGRFDRQIVVDVPDVLGREEILKIHSEKKPLDESVDLSRIAKVTSGYTGADLENLMNEAAIFAARRGKEKIDSKDIEDANIKVMMGAEKKSKKITEKERTLTAYHEAGHAIVSKLVDKDEKVHQVSIIPRGRAGGYTMYTPKEDVFYSSKGEMMNSIIKSLGGRAAEEIMLDDISTGASNDIKMATNVARSMITMYGMNEELGLVCYDNNEEVFLGRDFGHSKMYSEKTASQIDDEVKKIIGELYEKTKNLLSENKDILERVAKELLEKETLNEAEFEQIYSLKA
ncbi:MAG: ATP-dependent zinc metalloprotease FtsH [Clostridia bacterium]|nr:ATP-dependent zinc metalloprotease FtsH [Clostridia bacterium]